MDPGLVELWDVCWIGIQFPVIFSPPETPAIIGLIFLLHDLSWLGQEWTLYANKPQCVLETFETKSEEKSKIIFSRGSLYIHGSDSSHIYY